MIENAVITKTEITVEGIPTFRVHVEGYGWGCSLGGFSLAGHNTDPPTYGTVEPLLRICEVVGVRRWEDLQGSYCRVKIENQETHSIGNIIRDNWFDLKEFYGRRHEKNTHQC